MTAATSPDLCPELKALVTPMTRGLGMRRSWQVELGVKGVRRSMPDPNPRKPKKHSFIHSFTNN